MCDLKTKFQANCIKICHYRNYLNEDMYISVEYAWHGYMQNTCTMNVNGRTWSHTWSDEIVVGNGRLRTSIKVCSLDSFCSDWQLTVGPKQVILTTVTKSIPMSYALGHDLKNICFPSPIIALGHEGGRLLLYLLFKKFTVEMSMAKVNNKNSHKLWYILWSVYSVQAL